MSVESTAFGYSPEQLQALTVTLSHERLNTYLRRAGGVKKSAILLYEYNTAIAEALYGVTQAAEVTIRNAVHRILTEAVGEMWFDSPTLYELQRKQVDEAKYELAKNRRDLAPGALVAELRLGFWTSLISTKYEKSLWVPYLHKAFPHAWVERKGSDAAVSKSRVNRPEIFERLERIRVLRNRIAHHEPLLNLDLPRFYAETLGVLGWVCPTTSEWVRKTNRFPGRLHQKPQLTVPRRQAASSVATRPGKPSSDGV